MPPARSGDAVVYYSFILRFARIFPLTPSLSPSGRGRYFVLRIISGRARFRGCFFLSFLNHHNGIRCHYPLF